ncbi:arabinosidase, putative [Talaromyces stipitatus ATCC 10500]|uniref:Arabinosidase, putative n=1 Tax=Talaromyces stipitatus (strain ATCC 10500 / CBS 375.48 / QM 6759 / NRRL 1006) TaxID=441959 RepID=B8LUY7_TALSN|nr:arabinosidase, putative [Talaromyces stipitatus ATCC 10500]EED22608.1 arabinosidase, putative [Talaromyces stipitatus ATCC 10500]
MDANMVSVKDSAELSAQQALAKITIPNQDDIRGFITLPTAIKEGSETFKITWTSSNPGIVSDKPNGQTAAGVVQRPPPGAEPAQITLTASIENTLPYPSQKKNTTKIINREFHLTIQPSVQLAPFSRYGMVNFALSNCDRGQQIYMAYSIGNDPTRWKAANNGHVVLTSTKGMHAVRDPSLVRSLEGDKFYLLATDLNVDGTEHGWRGWDWAQSGASRYIEIWESRDLRTWSEQRHVLVGPPEASMVFAPEAIWDPEIGAYVVFWTSSMYPADTYFTEDVEDPKRRYPLTRNQTLYATTRDFVTFSPAKIMSGRENHGTLDACMVLEEETGYYHRFVCDRISTGVGVTRYAGPYPADDIYQERSKRVLAPEKDWELVASCITHKLMKTAYAEAPLAFRGNPGDSRGGYYFFSDQIWAESPAGKPLEEQLHPYWTEDLSLGQWMALEWTQKPEYDGCRGVMRHGTIVNLTCAEHAALRGVELVSLSVQQTSHEGFTGAVKEGFDAPDLMVTAVYSDGSTDVLGKGYGGYVLSDLGTCSSTSGKPLLDVDCGK